MSEVAPTSLVIDARKLQRLSMDGPALKVTMRGRSPMLFPLRRLLRIHIIGRMQQGMDTLLHCAEQQVPVAFFHLNGRLRCRLQPAAGAPSLIDHWFEHVEFDPEVRQLYEDWVLNQKLYALSRLGINSGVREKRGELVYQTLRGYCRRRLGRETLKDALEWLDGLVFFHLENLLAEYGFGYQRSQQKLQQDIKPLCDFWLLYALAARLQQSAVFDVTPRSMTAFYQQQAIELEGQLRRMLTQLVNRLEEVV